MYKCERCCCDERDLAIHDVVITGQVYALLCNRCRTDWSAFCVSHELQGRTNYQIARRARLDAMAAAGNPAILEDYVEHLTDQDRLQLAWNAVGREWLANGTEGA